MKLNYIQHIAIQTSDVEKSVSFYCDILGLKETKRVDMGNCTLVYIQVRDDCFLELVSTNGETTEGVIRDTDTGLRHFAFDVDNLEEWDAYLREKGVKFTFDLTEMPELGKKAVLVLDPDGTVIELCCDM